MKHGLKFTQKEAQDYAQLETVEARRLFLQYKYMADFKAFVRLLGYNDTGAFHNAEMDKIAEERYITKNPLKRLWLWSRGFFKTTLINQAHTVWLIVNNPDIRILLVSYTLDVAKKMLSEIKSPFLDNEEFRFFFREFCPTPNTVGKLEFGTSENFTIPNRNKKHLKEPTIMCAGVGTNLTGLHFDKMKIDDLVTVLSVTNETQIQASKDYYSALRQLYDNPTIPREDVIGTIYHYNDLHSEMLKSPEFAVKSIIPVHDKNGVYMFPERINKEGFDTIQNDPNMSPYDVSSQYLLTPLNPADAVFKEEWWQEYDRAPDGLAEYICVDPASAQKKKSDYTVIERWGVDSEGKHYLLEAIRDKLKSFERIDLLFEFVERSRNLQWVKYEVIGGRHGDLEKIAEEQRKRKVFFSVKETKANNAAKRDRVSQRLAGPWNAGVVFMPHRCHYASRFDGKVYDFVQDYKLEFLQFPYCQHDDCVDCHSQMFEEELVLGKSTEKHKPQPEMTMGEYAALGANRRRSLRLNPWLKFTQGYR